MKIKDLKKKIKNENIETPDILESVKEEYPFEIGNKPRLKNPFAIKVMIPVMTLVLVLTFVIIGISSKSGNNKFYSSTGFKTFSNKKEFEEVINYQKKELSFNSVFGSIFGMKGAASAPAEDSITNVAGNGTVSKDESSMNEVSKTNTQFDDVDEDDVIKCDGYAIYRLNNNHLYYNKLDDFENTKDIVLETLDSERKILHSHMYLTEEYVIIYYSLPNDYYEPQSSKALFLDKDTLEEVKTFEIDGYIVDTRLITKDGNETFIMISQKTKRISKFDTPKTKVDGVTEAVDYKDIYYTEDSTHYGYTTLTMANIDDSIELNSTTILGPSYYTNYMVTSETIYLTSPQALRNVEENVMSKFDYSKINEVILRFEIGDEKIEPYGSLITTGSIIDRFSIDEKDGYLRLALSEINNNHVEIYRIENNEFKYVSGIREGLGEANEVIKSARFNGDTLLVVTAKNTDPLYKIDLSDPLNPKIVGKFKEDGFNTILQYLKGDLEGYAFAFGYQTEDIDEYYNVKKGTKLDLYDITGENPVELDEINYTTTWFEAVSDIRAIFQYKNYIGFEVSGTYHLYEIKKVEEEMKLVEVLKWKLEIAHDTNVDWIFENDVYGLVNMRMYYANGYFYLSYVSDNTLFYYDLGTSGIVKFDSEFNLLATIK